LILTTISIHEVPDRQRFDLRTDRLLTNKR
jgi:hypothetical protein